MKKIEEAFSKKVVFEKGVKEVRVTDVLGYGKKVLIEKEKLANL